MSYLTVLLAGMAMLPLPPALAQNPVGDWEVTMSWEGVTNWNFPLPDSNNPGRVVQITGEEVWTGPPANRVMQNETGLPGTCSVSANGTVTVRIAWTGESDPPATIKLFARGDASAYATPGVQALDAANGLGASVVHETFPVATQVAYSIGQRYREIPVPDGILEIVFNVSAIATSFGIDNMAGAGVGFGASETGWAMFMTSERAPTYYRALDEQTGEYYARLNGLGLDGNYYADTDADIHFGDPLQAGLYDLGISVAFAGPWSPATTLAWSLVGLEELSAPDPFQRRVWIPKVEPPPTSPFRVGIATVAANDPTNSISDSISYILRVHLPAEKENPIAGSVWEGMLHTVPVPRLALREDYHALMLHNPLVNLTENSILRTYSIQFARTWTSGWVYTVEGGATMGEEWPM